MIEVGQKVLIKPFQHIRCYGQASTDLEVEGIVHFVHRTHHWFNVEHDIGAGKQLLSYKFDDIGTAVKLVEE